MIVRVTGPLGCGKYNVVTAGLEKMGILHRIVNCSLIEPLTQMGEIVGCKESVVVLTDLQRTRRDFREQILKELDDFPSKTFWILDEPD